MKKIEGQLTYHERSGEYQPDYSVWLVCDECGKRQRAKTDRNGRNVEAIYTGVGDGWFQSVGGDRRADFCADCVPSKEVERRARGYAGSIARDFRSGEDSLDQATHWALDALATYPTQRSTILSVLPDEVLRALGADQ